MNSSPSDLIGYYSLAKKNFGYKEAVGAWTIEIWSIYSLYFGYAYSVGDARTPLQHNHAYLQNPYSKSIPGLIQPFYGTQLWPILNNLTWLKTISSMFFTFVPPFHPLSSSSPPK